LQEEIKMIDYGKALSFFTEDPRWKEKLAIGTGVAIASFIVSAILVLAPSFILYMLFPWPTASTLSSILVYAIGVLFLVGYMVRLLQNVRDGQAQPLPEWNQWGNDLIRGFRLVVVNLIWLLPALIIAIPAWLGNLILNNNNEAIAFFGGMLLTGGLCLIFAYDLLVAIMMPGFTIAFARDEQLRSGLQIRSIWQWTYQHLSQVISVAVICIIAQVVLAIIATTIGAILCGIGLFITLPLAILVTYLFQSHLYGQLANAFPVLGDSATDLPSSWNTPADEIIPPTTPS
jgi:hypothetical protein